MNNNEFKKENNINIPKKSTDNKKHIQKTNNKSFQFLIILNFLIIMGIGYLIYDNLNIKYDINNYKEEIKSKLSEFEGLNNNVEKLNNNFQILDIINSNTRRIPDIIVKLEDNNKLLSNIDINDIKNLENTLNNLKTEITSSMSNLKDNEKLTTKIDELYLKLDSIKNEINNINTNVSALKNTKINDNNNSSDIIQHIDNSINSLNKEIVKKFEDIDFKFVLIDKKLSSNMNKNNDDNDVKVNDISDKISNLENSLKKDLENYRSSIENSYKKIQEEYYSKIEYLINKKDFIYSINKLDEYFKTDDFKLIEMVNFYNDLYIRFSTFKNDEEIIPMFEEITKKVYDKILNTIIEEKKYLESTTYNENIMKDIKYINYIFSKTPKNNVYYKKIESELKSLNDLESKKIEEYNILANYEINNFLGLFSKKIISEKEIMDNFENKILKINPNLLNKDIRNKYLDLVEKTKQILKDKYIW
ncbi:hypothetical protein [Marinitoga litoralis]|uniref:hypothetical protein n=1 Tax=Marinitoga litoralis TaxID=570855 RepID=UPI001961A965|nr:hypothetical protein [Marinitoga litoralis]MBM7558951.1 conjugal transfer/entry exclusion protein [Marinitoga litoralis]